MIDRRIKFRHIQCFVEISREGSFKAAAEKLLLTQPAISKTLKELEVILGHALFTRDRGGVRLTAEGETFLRFAEMSIASLQQGIDGISKGPGGHSGTLSVGVLPSVAARLIPAVAEQFCTDQADTLLRIGDGPHRFLLDRLKLGDLDLVLGRMGDPGQMAGISFSLLYRERVSFVTRPGHPLLEAPALSSVFDWPVVYPPHGSAIRESVDRFLVEQGIAEVPRRIETVSGAFGRVYVRNSDAVWIISEGVVANELATGILARLPFNTDATLGPIGIMTREDWDYTGPARALRRILRDTIARTEGISA